MNLGKENHDSKDAEQLKMVLETKEICLQKLNNENVILRRENKRLKNEKTTLEKEKATSEKEKATFETKKVDTVSLVWSKAQSPLNEASWSSEKQKEFDSLKIQLDKLENYNEVVLKAKNDQKKDNSKLRERIQHIQRDFEKKANAFDRLSGEMQETKEEIGHLLKENKRVLHIYEKLKEKQRNEMVIEEHICKLKNEIQDKEEKVKDLSLKLEERTTDTKKLNDLLQSNKQERVKEKKMYLEEIFTLNKGLENLRVEIKQKESTRNR
ncbi:uncharacterized protein LOC134697815 [Mytilus trossulus]|uniref:uncharacterized protein LOC134697815 n=1 Tax=Mytilus trossulus TaxID=6551 RepID=UPI003006B069